MAVAALNAVGLVVLAFAWYSAAQGIRPTDQTGELGIAIGALVLAGFGNAYGLTTARRAVNRQRRMADDAFRSAASSATPPAQAEDGTRPGEGMTRPDLLVAGSEMSMYHRQHCPLVAGKQVEDQIAAAHRRAGRRPCGVCQP